MWRCNLDRSDDLDRGCTPNVKFIHPYLFLPPYFLHCRISSSELSKTMFSPFLKSPVPRSYRPSKASPLAMTLSLIPTATVLGFVAFSTLFLSLCSDAVAQNKPTRIDLSNQAEFTYESGPQRGYSDPPMEFRGKTARIEESFDRLIEIGRAHV